MIYLLIVLCVFLSSCGYRVGLIDEGKLQLSRKSIHVQPLKNRTTNTRIQLELTEALRREFLRRGSTLKGHDQADLLLKGEIKRISTEGVSFLRYDRAVERRVGVNIALTLIDNRSGNVLWKNEDIYREESFFVGRELMETEGLMEDALKRLADGVARDVVHWIFD